jgi:hypothetical protein
VNELRGKIKELRKTHTIPEIATLLKISTHKVAYYSEDGRHYRERKRLERRNFLTELKREYGGKCCTCGYNKNLAALCFHHVKDKLHEVADLARNSRFTLAREEAKKCILLCANCHTELHNPN